MYGPDSGRQPMTAFEWTFSAIFLLGFLALIGAVIVIDFEPVKLMPVFFVLFWLVLLPIHEFGHAIIAWLLGWQVRRVVIGMGRALFLFRVGKTPVEVRTFPIEGFCGTVPRDLRWPRLKSALIYLAGPGVELLLLGWIVVFVGPQLLLAKSEHLGLIAWQGLALAIVASAFFNLVPHYAISQNGFIPNDGLGIILSFTKPLSYFEELLRPPPPPVLDRWRESDRPDDVEEDDPADWWKK